VAGGVVGLPADRVLAMGQDEREELLHPRADDRHPDGLAVGQVRTTWSTSADADPYTTTGGPLSEPSTLVPCGEETGHRSC
jgi:hypothetical protein